MYTYPCTDLPMQSLTPPPMYACPGDMLPPPPMGAADMPPPPDFTAVGKPPAATPPGARMKRGGSKSAMSGVCACVEGEGGTTQCYYP